MKSIRIYEAAVRAAVPLLRAASLFNRRLARGLEGRRATPASLAAFARDPARPLVWLHAPSVGEALMAQAILTELRRARPDVQSAFTFFSPSAERMAHRVGADWHGYLPWDRPRDVTRALDALAPDCVAFVRTEIWPVLVRECERRGIPTLMVNGVLADDSSRLRAPGRQLLRPAYEALAAVGAVSEDDARSFPRLGVQPERVHVTGDARFDQVIERARALDRDRPLLRCLAGAGRPWLVAGSTWPADEVRLIPALARLRTHWRTVFAPHEPGDSALAALERTLDGAGLCHVRLPQESAAEPVPAEIDVVVVDRVGVLADLYAAGDAAYVGGGFGTSGLHSVVEPAALGVPVLCGPRHGNAREAARLAAAGGAIVIRDATELERALERWAVEPAERTRAGKSAAAFVDAHRGGAAAGAGLILAALRTTRSTAGP